MSESERLGISESDICRMDPATLRRMRVLLGLPHGGWLDKLAAEAEARPPLLSDWVRACESTKLGSFTLGQTKNGLAFFFGEDGHEWIVDFHPDLTMAFIEKVDDCAAYVCATPAELTAALDRLAEEASRD